jgi:glutamate-ammonia-ligase adenylyltransferase
MRNHVISPERRPVPALRQDFADELAASADPVRAELGLARLVEVVPDAADRLAASPGLAAVVVAVLAASPFLTRTCVTDPLALDVLGDLDRPLRPLLPLARWKALEVLRIAAADLSGDVALEAVGDALAALADAVLGEAVGQSGLGPGLAVIAMGKLGARELNYGSDIDIMLVGEGDPHPMLALARQAWRTDLDLRPEGRAGVLVRSMASYQAYWDRWAQTWEFQALLKARPAAGDRALGADFARQAAARVWGRPLGADDLRSLRAMKARAEQTVARQGLSQREIKLGRGGIRDIEFAVQLLQLVHGRDDEALRAPATLAALAALAAGGYVAPADAEGLASAYRFLRAVEHRLQLFEDRQVHALPASAPARAHLARVLGYRDGRSASALVHFETDLAHHQATARGIHERLFFRPLLEAFSAERAGRAVPGTPPGARRTRAAGTRPAPVLPAPVLPAPVLPAPVLPAGAPAVLGAAAVSERLAAFGFSDATRTRDAVVELTQGFSRTSRLMHAMVPLLLDWLSEAPDPDLGLLGLRRLTTGLHRRAQLSTVFRESPEAARQLCQLLGTSPLFAAGYERHPDQLALLGQGPPPLPERDEIQRRAVESTAWRPRTEWWRGLGRLARGELLQAQARDVLGLADLPETARSLTSLAEAVVEVALGAVAAAMGGADHAHPATTGHPVAHPLAPVPQGAPGGWPPASWPPASWPPTSWPPASWPPASWPPASWAPVDGLAVVAMGRFGGAELAYASDLDILLVFDDDVVPAADAEPYAEALLKLVNGETPVQRLYELDLSLRPEGRRGSLARSLKAFESYYDRWAQVWERQALTRGRFVAGDPRVGARFAEIAGHFVWDKGLADDDARDIRRMKARVERERVPSGEDPEFHLKLGPGSLSDVEWTVQLLQLRTGVRAEGTLEALRALSTAGALEADDANVLAEAYRFCETTRNRLYLVRGRPGDSLPPPGHHLTVLARSLGMTAPELRDQYRRLTRRARRVTQRLFYGST